MTYQTIDQISQISTLLAFLAMSVAVGVYAFWPGNARTFEEAAQLPLQPDALDDEGIQ
jgi:cytochrome c oxidase cbb3-type subunit IV